MDQPIFEADASGYLSEHTVKMFLCPVQASNTKVAGWLAYPPITIDRDKWSMVAQELYIQVSPKDTPPIKVGLAWKALAGLQLTWRTFFERFWTRQNEYVHGVNKSK